jgi:hypothetical protein
VFSLLLVSDRKLEHLKTATTTGKEEGGIKRKKTQGCHGSEKGVQYKKLIV